MSTPFVIQPYDLTEIGTRGHGSLTAKIQGYWSQNPISVTIQRRRAATEAQWTMTVNHSSGGRDTKEVADDGAAAINFACALIGLVAVGHAVLAQAPVLEAAFQVEEDRAVAALEAKRAEKQALIDADAPLGLAEAERLIDAAGEALAPGQDALVVTLYNRGCHGQFGHMELRAAKGWKGGTLLRLNGAVIARKVALAALAEMSARRVPADA